MKRLITSRLIWIYAVCKSLLLPPVARKELIPTAHVLEFEQVDLLPKFSVTKTAGWVSYSEDPDQGFDWQGLYDRILLLKTKWQKEKYISWTPIARTPMARLPWLIRTRFWVPTKFFR